jgi:2-methylcitrate dehydratase PrpD
VTANVDPDAAARVPRDGPGPDAPPPEDVLGAFVAGLEPGAMPPVVSTRVRQHILDSIGCAIAGRSSEGRAGVAAVAARTFGPGRSVVIGGGALAPAGAALVNGFQIAAPTLGDVHRATLTHVMPEVLPAALASAQIHGARGQTLLAGVGAGMEVAVRVAEALDTPAYRERGFHNPGIAGAVGAACAAARVASLDGDGVRAAIGHAASQAAGTFAALGTSGVKLHQARGALTGLLSAELAAGGLDASATALTAERGGLLEAYAGGGAPERLTEGVGDRWLLESIALRRWPGASSLQPVIDAVLGLGKELRSSLGRGDPLDAIEAVTIELPPRAYALNGRSGWETRLAALQSARWTAAIALADGEVWLGQTSDERRADQRVGAFAETRVTVREDEEAGETGALVILQVRGGVRLERHVAVPPGDPRRPLDDAEIREKLARAAGAAGIGDRVAAIIDAVDGLEAAPSIQNLATVLAGTEEDR